MCLLNIHKIITHLLLLKMTAICYIIILVWATILIRLYQNGFFIILDCFMVISMVHSPIVT